MSLFFKFKIFLVAFSLGCLFAERSRAVDLSVEAGAGDWFGDETRSSFSYGGGILFKPGLDFLELSATYDRSPIKLKSVDYLAADLKGDSLDHWRFSAAFPSDLVTFGRKGYFFPALSYVLVSNGGHLSHGFGVGGGLGIPLVENILGVRFEAVSQFYRIPKQSGGSTAMQSDFFLNIRLEFKIL